VACFLLWIGLATSKWHSWKHRYGKANEHNAWIPRDHWLEEAEKQAIIDFHALFPLEGYRRLTFMMLDADVVACSPSSVYRVLKGAGLLERHNTKPSTKGTGFVQPLRPHEHWHVDVSYINIAGTFYYLCSLLDGCSRFTVHWELRETMTEAEVEQIIQRAREKFPWPAPKKWSSRYESRINRYEWVHAAVPNRSGRSSACFPRMLWPPTPFTQAEGVGGQSMRPTSRLPAPRVRAARTTPRTPLA